MRARLCAPRPLFLRDAAKNDASARALGMLRPTAASIYTSPQHILSPGKHCANNTFVSVVGRSIYLIEIANRFGDWSAARDARAA